MKDKNGIELHSGSPVEICSPATETRNAVHIAGVVMGSDKDGHVQVAYPHIHVDCFCESNLTSCEPLPPPAPTPVPEKAPEPVKAEKTEHHAAHHDKHKHK